MALEALNQKYVKEAMGCVKRAEEHLKTSILKMKFKPDYDSAAMEYERAAVCYRNASELSRSCVCYEKAAEMHFSNGNIFHSAKGLENAASLYKELGEHDKASSHMEVAIDRYAEAGTLDTAAMALDKAAKLFEKSDPAKAINFYKKAIEMVLQTDHSKMADDFTTRLTRLYLDTEQYKEAADTVDTLLEKYLELKDGGKVGQLALALVLIHLVREDTVAADKELQKAARCESFLHSQYANSCQALISTFESSDTELFRQILQRSELKSMDNEYLRLIKKLMVMELEGDSSNQPENIGNEKNEENLFYDEGDGDLK
uniref:Gamma-soluble NSF attachment protein n=1 Tax=Syphacia muris TaxID=451379 RepID=A0A158R5W2_9BILA